MGLHHRFAGSPQEGDSPSLGPCIPPTTGHCSLGGCAPRKKGTLWTPDESQTCGPYGNHQRLSWGGERLGDRPPPSRHTPPAPTLHQREGHHGRRARDAPRVVGSGWGDVAFYPSPEQTQRDRSALAWVPHPLPSGDGILDKLLPASEESRNSLCGLEWTRPDQAEGYTFERPQTAHPYLRPLFRASKIFFTCCVFGSGQTDPFRSVPYILEDFAGIRDLTEFLWMDFL